MANPVAQKIILTLLFLSGWAHASVSSYSLGGQWRITLPKENPAIFMPLGRSHALLWEKGGSSKIMMASQEPAVSIQSVRGYVLLYGANIQSLKVKRDPAGAIFQFDAPGGCHWMSTRGGHLQMPKSASRANCSSYLKVIQLRAGR